MMPVVGTRFNWVKYAEKLLAKPATTADFAKRTNLGEAHARSVFRLLRKQGLVHIVGYEKRGLHGKAAIYAWGVGQDAVYRRKSLLVIQRDYRAKKKDMGA